MQDRIDLEKTIDSWNLEFTDNARKPLDDLSQYSTESLEWLMMEHYQFSFANCAFLSQAAESAASFDTDAIKNELIRNFKEENGHAALYKLALKKIGSDVEARADFAPTSKFLKSIGEIVTAEPSAVLGSMFATETTAIFEHQVFLAVSEEVVKRKNSGADGKPLLGFHQMHLDGVEQSHKDELGIFLRGVYHEDPIVAAEGARPTINTQQVLNGGKVAIELMKIWWDGLYAELRAMNQTTAQTAQV